MIQSNGGDMHCARCGVTLAFDRPDARPYLVGPSAVALCRKCLQQTGAELLAQYDQEDAFLRGPGPN